MRKVSGTSIDLTIRCVDEAGAVLIERLLDAVLDLSYVMWIEGHKEGLSEGEE